MPGRLYTFFSFPSAEEGASEWFEALAFRSDDDAIRHIGRLFAEEPFAGEVVVYEGEREVFREVRPPRAGHMARVTAPAARIRLPLASAPRRSVPHWGRP